MWRIRSRKIKIEWTTRESEGRGRRTLNRRMEEKIWLIIQRVGRRRCR
jgi:hypothetical protein